MSNQTRSVSASYASAHSKVYWLIHDSSVVAWRNLLQFYRNVEAIFFDAIQPIIFILLFAFVFGGAIDVGDSSYRSFLIPGIFVQTIAFAGASSSVGLNDDMAKGLIDRFRSLPMVAAAVLFGRASSDLLRGVFTLIIMSLTGLAIGWRITGGVLNAIFAYLLLLGFGFAMIWIGSLIGLSVSNPQVASTAGFAWLFPLTFVSNAFVPTETMPSWLQVFAEWNPISSIVAAERILFGYPIDTSTGSFPMQHPIFMSVVWIVVITAIFMPLAIRKFKMATSR
jgi:ABC-2 type transport system permease protein